ncbi:hypothetical protein ACIQNU_03945 [Streptomyces sp. NPDC091292]|uniref:hypothetical protein n=1 Tax=Streptomyces sp. NPDC091292 TaxID=3365991 RepID=UPI003802EDD7
MTRPISDLDVPLSTLREQMTALVARQQQDVSVDRLRRLLAEQAHQVDTSDTAYARLACDHPEACSCDADYPNWTPGSTT